MTYKLVSKEELDGMEFTEKFGMINIYSCPNCRHLTTYLYLADRITPHVILCSQCGGEAYTQIADIRQPSLIWYRPKGLKELQTLADAAYEITKAEFSDVSKDVARAKILTNYIEHYNLGGLFATSIVRSGL